MIKIVCGVYGHYVNGRVIAKDNTAEPFSLPDYQEAALVAAGIAEYVDAPADQAAQADIERAEGEKSLDDMTAKELRELGKEYGLTFKVGMTKAEMVDAILAAMAEPKADEIEDDAEDEETEDQPELGAADVVVE